MRPQELERIIRKSLNEARTDKELIAFRKLLQEVDKDVEMRLASTSKNAEILYHLARRIGPGYTEARTIAEQRLKDLFPEKHRDIQGTNHLIKHMVLRVPSIPHVNLLKKTAN